MEYRPDDHPELIADFDSWDQGMGDDVTGIDQDGVPVFGSLPPTDMGFFNKYGLLGLGGAASQAGESLKEIQWARGRMSVYRAFVHDDPKLGPAERARNFNRSCPAAFQAVLEVEGGRTILKLKPTTLEAWMWLQLAKEKDGGTKTKRCPHCGNFFSVGPGQNEMRPSAKYCSPSCQINAWKKVKREEERKRKEGSKPTKKGGSK